jgi:precorrin-3B methylase
MYNRQVNNVSPLSRELIIKLAKENDSELLREVLNYYAFLKNKKEQEARKQWESIEEVQPDKEEIEIINEFEKNREKFEFVSMEEVLKELGIDESELQN